MRPATASSRRAAVERDLLHARAEDARESYYQRLRANYKVRIESAGEIEAGPAG